MLIKVVFKKNKADGFDNQEFTYAGYEGVEVGDIVVVNTRYGFAIAKVTEVAVESNMFSEGNIATVETIIKSAKVQREEQARIEAYKALAAKVHRAKLEKELSIYLKELDMEDSAMINNMTDSELEDFCRMI